MYLIGSQYNIRIFRIMNNLFYNALRVYIAFVLLALSFILVKRNKQQPQLKLPQQPQISQMKRC